MLSRAKAKTKFCVCVQEKMCAKKKMCGVCHGAKRCRKKQKDTSRKQKMMESM